MGARHCAIDRLYLNAPQNVVHLNKPMLITTKVSHFNYKLVTYFKVNLSRYVGLFLLLVLLSRMFSLVFSIKIERAIIVILPLR